MQSPVQIIDPVLNCVPALRFQAGANFLVLQWFVRLKTKLGTLFHAWLVRLGPIDDANRVVDLGVIWIDVRRHMVVLFGILELLHLQIQIGDALNAVDLLFLPWVPLNDVLIFFNGLLGHFVIVRSIGAGNVLLRISRSQIKTCHD